MSKVLLVVYLLRKRREAVVDDGSRETLDLREEWLVEWQWIDGEDGVEMASMACSTTHQQRSENTER